MSGRIGPRVAAAPRRGFTIVELLVVLAIAAVLMAAVPPLISAVFPGVELKAAARRTAASLRLVRETAIRTGAEAALVVNVEERTLEGPGRGIVTLPHRIRLRLNAAVREQIDADRGAIRFFPDGSSTGGVVVLARADVRSGYQVGVNWLTGRVRLAPWADK
ncbi:GspH/FimT family pseudopilin [uncultured Thiodictyon sp.]|uniref:GspH/FimT family pseudopilin n=1 Tax=uncultured Thiodictyon sp. TaxID=1846217 RepID=UPI0025EA9138|nr:GspH/FimT family pseudopilin [uncultured Thiodictyon sp.]